MKKISVIYTPHFAKSTQLLWRRYPRIPQLIANLAKQLENGELLGDQVPNVGYTVYKVRLPNPDAQRGKSGGFRVIYYLRKADVILLIAIYSKTDQVDIPISQIAAKIQDYESGE